MDTIEVSLNLFIREVAYNSLKKSLVFSYQELNKPEENVMRANINNVYSTKLNLYKNKALINLSSNYYIWVNDAVKSEQRFI